MIITTELNINSQGLPLNMFKLKVEIESTPTLIFTTLVRIIFSVDLTLNFINSNALNCFRVFFFVCFFFSSNNVIICMKICVGHFYNEIPKYGYRP